MKDNLDVKIQEGKEFIRNRITELRLNANISEYKMSFELGQSKSYIQSISSGKAMPSMAGFLNICDYFGITPVEFFDTSVQKPILLNEIVATIKSFDEDDLELLLSIAKRIERAE